MGIKLMTVENWLNVPASSMSQKSTATGFLLKEGGKSKVWRRRYFVLKYDWFIYYETEQSESPIGALYLGDSVIESIQGLYNSQVNCFRIRFPNSKSYVLSCEPSNPHGLKSWISLLTNACYPTVQEQAKTVKSLETKVSEMAKTLEEQSQLILEMQLERSETNALLSQSRSREEHVRSLLHVTNTTSQQTLGTIQVELSTFQNRLSQMSFFGRVTANDDLNIRLSCLSEEKSDGLNKNGWLYKRGLLNRSKRKRWFVLKGYTLMYFKEPQDFEPLGVIELENCVLNPTTAINRQSAGPGGDCNFTLVNAISDRTYQLVAANVQEKEEWVDTINKAIQLAKDEKLLSGMSQLAELPGSFEELATQLPHVVNNIEKVIDDPTQLQCFQAFLMKEHSVENLMFYLDVQNLKQVSERVVPIACQNIWLRYIESDSPLEINLTATTVESLRENMNVPDVNTFRVAELEILGLMRDDSFPRFVRAVTNVKNQ